MNATRSLSRDNATPTPNTKALITTANKTVAIATIMTAASAHLRALTTILALFRTTADQSCSTADETCVDTGRYKTWEESPASWEEFGHDNDKSICRLPIISVEEWEKGQYWLRQEPVIVKNVTKGWGALEHWTK
jgi:hypothetical protein